MASRRAKFIFRKVGGALQPISVHYPAWVAGLADGAMVMSDCQQYRHEKTNPQLAYWYAVILPHIEQALIDAGNDALPINVELKTTVDNVDMMMKQLFQAQRQLGELPEKKNMSDTEMSDLIDFTLRYAAESFGLAIPSPKEKR